jgi:hypothetical protein
VVDDRGAMKEPASSHRRAEGEESPQYPVNPESPAGPRPKTPTRRPPPDQPSSTASADGLKDRRSRDDQSRAAEPPAWRVLLAYARPYRLTLVVGGLLSLATGAVGLALPLTAKRLVDDLAQDRSVTQALLLSLRRANGVIMRRHSESSGDERSGPGPLAAAAGDVDSRATPREAPPPSVDVVGPPHSPSHHGSAAPPG